MVRPTIEFGLDTFGDVTVTTDGSQTSQAQVIRDVVEEGVLADELGIDFFGVGEHHRADFAISSPEMVLAAIAGRTKSIRLGSAVTVLSSDDPVRVFQRFSTLDAVSSGRAEVIVGRGSFTESFPLFGLPLDQYEELFEEKLDLFATLLREEQVTWHGTVRPSLKDQTVFPRTIKPLTAWVGVGGSPQSIVRAAHHALPVMLAIIGGDPARFKPYVDLFQDSLAEFGHPGLPIGVHSPGHVAPTDEEAQERFWPHYKAMHDTIGRERGWSPMARDAFDREVEGGSLYVGSAETVARKIARTCQILGTSRFQLKYSAGGLPHAVMMDSIEQYGTKVIPLVREMLAGPAVVSPRSPTNDRSKNWIVLPAPTPGSTPDDRLWWVTTAARRTTNMRAMAIDDFGGPEKITAHEIPAPVAGSGEILVKLSYAGVGVWDGAMRQGLMEEQAPAGASLPRILGADGSGIVAEVGAGVAGFAEGDQVYVYSFFNPSGGSYAEFVSVPAEQAALVPAGLPMDQAGALAVTGLTALRGLDDTLAVKAGDSILIYGASGGVGLAAVQLAKILGAEVLATVASESGAAAAREAGADVIVNSKTEDLAKAIATFAPHGLAGVLALVGGESMDIAIAAVNKGGRVAFPFGVDPAPTGAEGVEAVGYMGSPGRDAFDKLSALVARGPFALHLAETFPLGDAAKAHEKLADHHVGRMVLSIE